MADLSRLREFTQSSAFDKLMNIMAAMMIFAGGIAITLTVESYLRDRYLPIHFVAAWGPEGTVRRGEIVTLYFQMKRHEICAGTVAHFWVAADNRIVKRLPEVRAGYTLITEEPITLPVKVSIPISDEVGDPVSGNIGYRANITSVCGSGVYMQAAPEVWVAVEPDCDSQESECRRKYP